MPNHFKKYDYDEETRVLTLQFENDRRYNYYNVPKPLFKRFENAVHKDKFFSKHIRGVYEFKSL